MSEPATRSDEIGTGHDAEPGLRGRRRPGADLGRPARRGASEQAGFALLVALLALVGVSALAAGGFFLANSERSAASNYRTSVDAFYLAQMGLSDYVGGQSGVPSEGTTSYTYTAGEADVTVTEVGSTSNDGRLFRVSSEGRADDGGALRRLELVVMSDPQTIPTPPGGLVSGAGVNKSGASGSISGEDACGQAGSVAGVRAPSYSGHENPLSGDPPKEITNDPFGGFVGQAWWDGMRNGDLVQHEYVVTSASDWPDFSSLPSDAWPVIYVDDASIELGNGESGRGLIITQGNATLKGSFEWDGGLLVGGSITDNGTGYLNGVIVTGLNRLLGESVTEDDLQDSDLQGTKSYQYDSCNLGTLNEKISRLVEVSGTWREIF